MRRGYDSGIFILVLGLKPALFAVVYGAFAKSAEKRKEITLLEKNAM